MQIIGVKFENSSRTYSYYCTVENVNVNDVLLSPDGKAVTVVELDIDQNTIPANIMQIIKTITERAGEVAEVVASVTDQTDLITIQQLPVIVEQLHSIKAAVSKKVAAILALPCTEDTVKEIKKYRADLTKDFKDYEARREFVKSEILKPYEAFETVYKECVTDLFTGADNQLREAIASVEDGLKNEKRAQVEAHYLERLASFGLDFPAFALSGIKVGLSDTETSLMKQVDDFTARVARDIDAIKDLPFADEIIVEYKARLDASYAIKTVNARHKAMEEVREKMDVTPISAPSIPAPPPVVPHVIVPTKTDNESAFTIRVVGSQRKFDALKKFLDDGWYEYQVMEG